MLPSELEMKSKYPWVKWKGLISQSLQIGTSNQVIKIESKLAYRVKTIEELEYVYQVSYILIRHNKEGRLRFPIY